MWSDERDIIMKLFEENNEKYPKICPCCGEKSGHIFMFKNRENDIFGSAWAWCSKCQEYSHSRYLIPKWWKNFEGITLDELHARPDNLDKISEAIDKWINKIKDEQ